MRSMRFFSLILSLLFGGLLLGGLLFGGLLFACSPEPLLRTASPASKDPSKILASFALPEADLPLDATADRAVLPHLQASVPTSPSSIVLAEIDPLEVSGAIRVDGSSTVFPITQRMAQRFIENGFPEAIQMAMTTTADGFAQLCPAAPTIELVNASRLMNAEEAAACKANGHTPLYFQIGYNRIVLLRQRANYWLPAVTTTELAQIFAATAWNQINPTWPQRPIAHIYPQLESDSALIMQNYLQPHNVSLANAAIAPQFFDAEIELIQALSAQENGIGFVSYHTYLLNSYPAIELLAIDGHTPSDVGRYPLEQPLYLYMTKETLRAKPQIAAFVAFYLVHIDEASIELGFFPITLTQLNAQRLKYQRVMKEGR